MEISDNAQMVLEYLLEDGEVCNGEEGVCYRTGLFLNKTGYYSKLFKEDEIYHCEKLNNIGKQQRDTDKLKPSDFNYR